MSDPARVLLKALRKAKLPAHAVLWTGVAVEGAPPPMDGPWVLTDVVDVGIAVGASARRVFRPYAVVDSVEAAARLAVNLVRHPASVEPLRYDPPDYERRGQVTAAAIRRRAEARSNATAPSELEVGDLLDSLEPETAHHLYPAATPFGQRSLPDTWSAVPHRVYEVRRPFADAHSDSRGPSESTVAPSFGQPGGGGQVVLDRPIRWYVDQGFLTELVRS
ncbi:glycohydrolase toxin TNT-related protein [Nocardioides mangrovicus]|uniref:glycohydrolase toxin TNT-related protein n=1 Tax=Nocardioides mangrovicus TaxID=2478913 RepID=UPI001313E62F|nr:glycohydrolase toxin TNT-related protein [Nocardioides mangrovicus]